MKTMQDYKKKHINDLNAVEMEGLKLDARNMVENLITRHRGRWSFLMLVADLLREEAKAELAKQMARE